VQQLQLEVERLQAAIGQMQAEALRDREESRAENLRLKQELQKLKESKDPSDTSAVVEASGSGQIAQPGQSEPASRNPASQNDDEQRIAKLEEDQQLLSAKIDDQYQTKVESASKHRVKLSGIVLLNLFNNNGNVDHFEIPGIALPTTSSLTGGNTGGSLGGTLRQSQLGLEIFGPSLAGAKTRANFVADFLGDFPDTLNGFSAGTLRLRTGTVRLDWENTSVIGGQDNLFFVPVYPTSYASLGIPALSYAGNLWAWAPQLRVEHNFAASERDSITVAGGILDPLTGELPTNEFLRAPGAGESSRRPGFGGRVAWTRQVFGQPLTIGAGGYYDEQSWTPNHQFNGWAGTTDWNIPLGKLVDLSGTFYRGEAIGGFSAGAGRTVLVNGPLGDPATIVRPAQSMGGWSQFKIKPWTQLEFNVAGGQDGVPAHQVRGFTFTPFSAQGSPLVSYFPGNLTRNRSGFVNFIYRPRSNLLFSAEFRTLRTFTIEGRSDRANQINLIMGVFF
jgi:hypothetical protein